MTTLRYFWASLLPENQISKYRLSVAACNFSYNLISGGIFTSVFSTLPPYVHGEILEPYDDRFILVYSKLRKNRITSKLAALYEQFLIFKKIPQNSSFWFYNLDLGTALLFILLKIFKPSVLLNVIVLDFSPVTKGIGVNTFCLKLINKADGMICLSESPLFKSSNKFIIPGIVPLEKQDIPKIDTLNKKFLLSGALNETIAQTSMVLKAFSQLPSLELHITKQMGDSSLIEEYSKSYTNIIYHESLSYSEYIDLLHSITYQLSTRNPNAPENQCNFPSKIIEALYHNRIVLSTIEYPQLEDVQYHYVSSEIERFISDLNDITSLPSEIALSYANQSETIYSRFSPKIWKKRMSDIEKVGRNAKGLL